MGACITNISNKKILFAYHRLDVIGGIETRWIDEFKYLKKQLPHHSSSTFRKNKSRHSKTIIN